jgi:hypothetical protein
MVSVGYRASFNHKEVFRVSVCLAILDNIIAEIDNRFSGQQCDVMTGIQSLSPTA